MTLMIARGRRIRGAGGWTTVFNQTLTTERNGLYTYCVRQVIEASLWSPAVTGTKIRITVKASGSNAWTLTEMFIQEQAAAGDAWDYAATPTRITWDGGNNGFAPISGGATKLSDEVTFAFDGTRDYVIGWDNSQTAGQGSMAALATLAGAQGYEQIIDGDAATVNASGYSPAGAPSLEAITKIEVLA